MAYPTRQGVGVFAEGENGASFSPAWPTHQAGDIGILLVESNNWWTFTNAQGFEELPWSPSRDGSASQLSTSILKAFWKRATGSAEAAPSIVAASGANQHARGVIVTIRGVGAQGVPWAVGDSDEADAATTSVSFPDVTTIDPETLLLFAVTNSLDVVSPRLSGWTNAGLTNLSEWVDSNSSIGEGSGLAVATGEKATAGAIGTTTATLASASRHARLVIGFSEVDHEDKSPRRGLVGTVVEHASADITVDWPTHVAGDIGILVAEGGAAPTLASAEGFTQVTAPVMAGTGASGSGLGVWWKRATSAAEASPVVDYSTDHIRGLIFTIKGVKPDGNPVNVAGSAVTGAASASVSMPDVTTTVKDCMVIEVLGNSIDAASDNQVFNWEKANLEGIAEIFNFNSASVGGSGIAIAVGRKNTPGATGAVTASLAASSHQSKIVFALEGLIGINFQADKGTFAMTGQAASFKRGLKLPADVGAFALTGQDVTFPIHFNYVVQAEVGAFVLSGGDVTFTKRLVNWSKEPVLTGSWFKELPLS